MPNRASSSVDLMLAVSSGLTLQICLIIALSFRCLVMSGIIIIKKTKEFGILPACTLSQNEVNTMLTHFNCIHQKVIPMSLTSANHETKTTKKDSLAYACQYLL